MNQDDASRDPIREPLTQCPIRSMIDVLGGKWKQPIICILSSNGPTRYNTLKRRLGNITNMMLSKSLKELESNRMIVRTQFNEIPPHVEYSLTEKGSSVVPILVEAAQWSLDHMND